MSSFIRINRNHLGEPLTLQTAVVTYSSQVPGVDVEVDLIGVIHIADRSYYLDLQEHFTRYDKLLFEVVSNEQGVKALQTGQRPGFNPLGILYGTVAKGLGLVTQFDTVSYSPENFVHADLSFKEIGQSIVERDEEAALLLVRSLRGLQTAPQERVKNAPEPPSAKELRDILVRFAASPRDEIRNLKCLFAQNLVTNFEQPGRMKDLASFVILENRNQAAINVLLKELQKGAKRVGIFYGAAHLPDLESRLASQCGLQRRETVWKDAWNLDRPAQLRPEVIVQTLAKVKNSLKDFKANVKKLDNRT